MRIHTNALIASDVYAATRGLPNVVASVTTHASRTHALAVEVKLVGNSPSRPNDRGASGDVFAATWDEWGMVLDALFLLDPDAIVGTVNRPIYAGREHFRWATGARYDDLRDNGGQDMTHRRHKWEFSGESPTGSYWVHACARGKNPCGAIRRAGSDAYVSDNFGATVGA